MRIKPKERSEETKRLSSGPQQRTVTLWCGACWWAALFLMRGLHSSLSRLFTMQCRLVFKAQLQRGLHKEAVHVSQFISKSTVTHIFSPHPPNMNTKIFSLPVFHDYSYAAGYKASFITSTGSGQAAQPPVLCQLQARPVHQPRAESEMSNLFE